MLLNLRICRPSSDLIEADDLRAAKALPWGGSEDAVFRKDAVRPTETAQQAVLMGQLSQVAVPRFRTRPRPIPAIRHGPGQTVCNRNFRRLVG